MNQTALNNALDSSMEQLEHLPLSELQFILVRGELLNAYMTGFMNCNEVMKSRAEEMNSIVKQMEEILETKQRSKG